MSLSVQTLELKLKTYNSFVYRLPDFSTIIYDRSVPHSICFYRDIAKSIYILVPKFTKSFNSNIQKV